MDIEELRTELLAACHHLPETQRQTVMEAADLATEAHTGQTRKSGDPYVIHPFTVATTLAKWGADQDTIIAGLLHDTIEDTPLTEAQISEQFGADVAWLVHGVTKFSQAHFRGQESLDRKVETLRKLFEVMRHDIRALIIKLADRLHNIHTIHELSPKRQVRFAKETMDVYYKLAEHLGMNDVRREFSEYCMPLLYPKESDMFLERRAKLRSSAEKQHAVLKQAIAGQDVADKCLEIKMMSRSLCKLRSNLSRKDREDYPYLYLVIAKDRDACYEILKILHTSFRPVSGRFRDYIAVPTENAYQSIRTVIIGPDGDLLPVRIRTQDMDEQERHGILLRCFGNRGDMPGFSWLARSETLDHSTRESSDAFWQALQSDIFQERIQVSMNGEEIAVPVGSTALDAVYLQCSYDGNRAHHIMVNGSPVSRSHVLADDDVIAYKLNGHEHVTMEWLDSVATKYARNLIVESLKERGYNEKIVAGRRLLQKEFDQYRKGLVAGLSKHHQQSVAQHFERDSFEAVIAMIGEGVLPARDVVFFLYPEHQHRNWFGLRSDTNVYPFQIRITSTGDKRTVVQSQTLALAGVYDIHVQSTHSSSAASMFELTVSGHAPNRLRFADFLSALEKQEDISNVRSLLSYKEKLWLAGCFFGALAVIVLDVLFLPSFRLLPLHPILQNVLPLIPIVGVNHFLLRILQYHTNVIRQDRWFIGSGAVLNLTGLTLVVIRSTQIGMATVHIIPMMAVFMLSTLYLAVRFFKIEEMLSGPHKYIAKPPSKSEWQSLTHKKIVGYSIRLCAVTVWGTMPLYLKYTPSQQINPLVHIFLMCVGALLVTGLFSLRGLVQSPEFRRAFFRIPHNIHLVNMIIGDVAWMYFIIASLMLTTSTNLLLLQNFAPVMTLLIAAILWRHTIPYLKDSTHIIMIFIVFLLGSTGSSLIIYNSITNAAPHTVYGDLLGILTMAADTVLIIGQIRYLKLFPQASGPGINFRLFSTIGAIFLPVMIVLALTRASAITGLSWPLLGFGIGSGMLLGGGQLLNYEAFRRIDGFIAFLMFNVSILITFIIEVFVLEAFKPTWLLLLGGMIIISSTVLAEMINSRCQKQGL